MPRKKILLLPNNSYRISTQYSPKYTGTWKPANTLKDSQPERQRDKCFDEKQKSSESPQLLVCTLFHDECKKKWDLTNFTFSWWKQKKVTFLKFLKIFSVQKLDFFLLSSWIKMDLTNITFSWWMQKKMTFFNFLKNLFCSNTSFSLHS